MDYQRDYEYPLYKRTAPEEMAILPKGMFGQQQPNLYLPSQRFLIPTNQTNDYELKMIKGDGGGGGGATNAGTTSAAAPTSNEYYYHQKDQQLHGWDKNCSCGILTSEYRTPVEYQPVLPRAAVGMVYVNSHHHHHHHHHPHHHHHQHQHHLQPQPQPQPLQLQQLPPPPLPLPHHFTSQNNVCGGGGGGSGNNGYPPQSSSSRASSDDFPLWLKIYSRASIECDHKLHWDMFNIRDLFFFDNVLVKLYELDLEELILSYKCYKNALLREMDKRLLKANQQRQMILLYNS